MTALQQLKWFEFISTDAQERAFRAIPIYVTQEMADTILSDMQRNYTKKFIYSYEEVASVGH